jgi:nucleotide-binding universal stress UspA family protein
VKPSNNHQRNQQGTIKTKAKTAPAINARMSTKTDFAKGVRSAIAISGELPLKIQKILVPTDFSHHADRALAYAIELAKAAQARIEVLHVCQVPRMDQLGEPLSGVSYPSDVIDDARQQILAAAKKRVGEICVATQRQGVQAEGFTYDGTVHALINRHAKEKGADILVVGTHGRTGLTRVLLGSVAARLVRTCPAAVITVPAHGSPSAKGDILVAYDFSDAAKDTLRAAGVLQKIFGGKVHVVNIEPWPWDDYEPDPNPGKNRSLHDEAVRVGLEAMLARDVRDAFGDQAENVGQHVLLGPVTETLLKVAGEVHAALVCVGATGKSGVERLLLGSVAESLIRLSPVPVFVVHHPKSA